MTEPQIRFATPADLDRFYAGRDKPAPTLRAMVAVIDDKPVAIAGVAYPPNAAPVVFSEITEEMRRHRKTIVRGARAALAAFARPGMLAAADPDEAGAARLLPRLGFRHVAGHVYRWERPDG